MQIKFLETQVITSNLITGVMLTDEEVEANNKFELSFFPAVKDDDKRQFLIVFTLSLLEKMSLDEQDNDWFSIHVQFGARFSTDEDIDDVFMESNFVKVNAPAIAYPYLRAYIGNLTINSGIKPITLETMNFTTWQKQERQEL